MNRLAGVDLRQGELIIDSYDLTEAGFWVANGKYLRMAEDVSDEALGSAVLEMHRRSEHGRPIPSRDDPSPALPILQALGLRSYSQYMRGTVHVSVRQDDSGVLIEPSHNGGARTGFTPLPGESIRIAHGSAREIGRAVRVGLSRAD